MASSALRRRVALSEESIQRAERLLRSGKSRAAIRRELRRVRELEEVVDLAAQRIEAVRRGVDPRAGAMFFDPEGLRVTTNFEAAAWRAQRLACGVLLDLACGVGGQAIASAGTCGEVRAVDNDRRRIGYARWNAAVHHRRNIQFACGDATGPAAQRLARDADVVFLDPHRTQGPPSSDIVDTLRPSPAAVIAAHPELRDRTAIQLPTQIRPEAIPWPCEREYIGRGGKVDRLTVYLGRLAKDDRSVVLVPEGARFAGARDDAGSADPAGAGRGPGDPPAAVIAELHPALVVADLVERFVGERLPGARPFGDPPGPADAQAAHGGGRRTLVTAEEIPPSPFVIGRYRREAVVPYAVEDIRRAAQAAGIGRLTLRFGIAPDDYWRTRTELERDLPGESRGVLFRVGPRAVLCSVIDRPRRGPG